MLIVSISTLDGTVVPVRYEIARYATSELTIETKESIISTTQ